MTSPDMNNTGSAGYGAGTSGRGNSDTQHEDGSGRTDDVSFARNLGVDQTSEKVKDAAQRGITSAEDAMGQLQAKASEFTSNLIDKIDIDDLTQKLEQQVREHPTRTLMLAAGAGFLLGRAAKK